MRTTSPVLLLAAACLVANAHAALEEIGDARDLTFKIKTNDGLVVGIFEKKGSAEEKAFNQVAKDMAPDGGILFAVTYDAKVAKKYLPDGPPAVAAFTNFDPETGLSKKHVKGKAFTSDFDYGSLFKFCYAEALPCITRVPINMGPDASKRNRVRFSALSQCPALDLRHCCLRCSSALMRRCLSLTSSCCCADRDERWPA